MSWSCTVQRSSLTLYFLLTLFFQSFIIHKGALNGHISTKTQGFSMYPKVLKERKRSHSEALMRRI